MDRSRVLRYVGVSTAALGLVATGAIGANVAGKYSQNENEYRAMVEQKYEYSDEFFIDQAGHRQGRGKGHRDGAGLSSLINDGTLTRDQLNTFKESLQSEMQAQKSATLDKVLAELVASSTLTQEQADQIKAIFENKEMGNTASSTSA